MDIKAEFYLGVTIDGAAGGPIVMVSSEGGVAVEETAAKSPKRIDQYIPMFSWGYMLTRPVG